MVAGAKPRGPAPGVVGGGGIPWGTNWSPCGVPKLYPVNLGQEKKKVLKRVAKSHNVSAGRK